MTLKFPQLLSNGNKWLETQQASILSAAAVITASVFLSSIIGLVRNRLLVTTFFKTPELQQQLEAYWVAFRLPELVFQLLIIGAVSAAFIPIFTKYEQKSKQEAFQFASSLLNMLLLVFIAFSVVIFIFALPFTRLMTGDGFSESQIQLAAQMTRLMLLAQGFFAVSNFLSGMIQSYKRFIVPALSPIAYNLGIIFGTVALTPQFGIFGPAIGVVIGAFFHVLLQIPLAIKLGFRYYPQINFRHPGVREVALLMGPRTLSLSVSQLQLFAMVFFATHLGGISLTIINLAQQLMSVPIRIIGAPIGQAALPFLSRESSHGDLKRFKGLVLQSVHQISFMAMPAAVLLLILRIPIVRLAYGAKDFPWPATVMTGKMVAILSISIAAQAITHILVRSFYALQNTKTPLMTSILSVATFLGLSAVTVFGFEWGLLGLAFSLTVANLVEMFLLLVLLDRHIHFLSLHDFWLPQLKMLLTSFLMAVFLWIPFRIFDELIFDTSRTLDVIGLTVVVGTIGSLTYFFFALLLDVNELYIIQKVFSLLGNWKKYLGLSTEVVETAGQSDESKV